MSDDGAAAPYVHPRGLCDSATVGPGTKIWAFSHVLEGAIVGADCNIGETCFVEDGAILGDRVTVKNGVAVWAGVTLEDDVFVGPAAQFTNDFLPRAAPYRTPREEWLPTLVRAGACIGANATILCGVVLGEHCLVAAGSVVTTDVPSHGLVVGNPARRVGWVCRCGARLTVDDGQAECAECAREFDLGAEGLFPRA
jgi:UDP-2-acetamido-3-amino-2,3-dideoxy-glucuronate N-acetyltransferase